MADRQGLFKGDLNDVQSAALAWLMRTEREEMIELERERFKLDALVNNAALYKAIMNQEREEKLKELLEWTTPRSVEEIMELMEGTLTGREIVQDRNGH